MLASGTRMSARRTSDMSSVALFAPLAKKGLASQGYGSDSDVGIGIRNLAVWFGNNSLN
jgi:hypothetical protein